MSLWDSVNETVARAMELKRDTDDVLLTSLRTQLAIVRTLCMLARQETGNERSHHLERAKKASNMLLELAKRLRPRKQERDEIEEVRQDVLALGTTSGRA